MNSILFIVGAVIMALLDVIWMGTLFAKFYKREIGDMGRIVGGEFKPHPAGILVYFLMSLGIMLFVLPKVGVGEWHKALLYGALNGLIIGGVYDLTNYSVLSHWSLRIVFLDMFWIVLSSTITTFALYLIREYFSK